MVLAVALRVVQVEYDWGVEHVRGRRVCGVDKQDARQMMARTEVVDPVETADKIRR